MSLSSSSYLKLKSSNPIEGLYNHRWTTPDYNQELIYNHKTVRTGKQVTFIHNIEC